MVLDRPAARIDDRSFRDLPGLLRPGDCLVLNETRVSPCRLMGCIRDRAVEILIVRIEERSSTEWDVDAMVYPGRSFKIGVRISLGGTPVNPAVVGEVTAQTDVGRRIRLASVDGRTPLQEWQTRLGRVPFPPYITNDAIDPRRYQTCYSQTEGSTAAPTAGLHFTPELLDELVAGGVRIARLTLHVGPGTFRPVTAREIAAGRLHAEPYRLTAAEAETIQSTKAAGGRVVAVGTTVCRTLEWIAAKFGEIRPDEGVTDLFIREGHAFGAVDALITNFHLPRTSLLMLVCAFAGRNFALGAYRAAVERGFRFYSFGDAMLIV